MGANGWQFNLTSWWVGFSWTWGTASSPRWRYLAFAIGPLAYRRSWMAGERPAA